MGDGGTHEGHDVVEVSVIDLDGHVVQPRLHPVVPPCGKRDPKRPSRSAKEIDEAERHGRSGAHSGKMVDLRMSEPVESRRLYRADHELPSWRARTEEGQSAAERRACERWDEGRGTDDVKDVLVVVLLGERPRRTSRKLLLDLLTRAVWEEERSEMSAAREISTRSRRTDLRQSILQKERGRRKDQQCLCEPGQVASDDRRNEHLRVGS